MRVPAANLSRARVRIRAWLFLASICACDGLCAPRIETAPGNADTTATSTTASATSGPGSGAHSSNSGFGDSTDSSSTATSDADAETNADEGVGFIKSPDGGSTGGCRQPELVSQSPTCDDGMREPGEFCYQGVASRYAMPEGAQFADFGAGPQIAYVSVESGDALIGPATVEGVLSESTMLGVAGWAYGFAVDDVDDDGPLDLIIAHSDNDNAWVTVHRGLGDGTFVEWTTSEIAGMAHLQQADLDGDGRNDLVGTTDYYYETGDLHLAIGLPDGSFVDAGIFDFGDYVVASVGDFDVDGLDDLALLVMYGYESDERAIVTIPMTPTGPAAESVLDDNVYVGRPVVGWFDGDSVLDIAYRRDEDLVFHAGNDDGTFSPSSITEANDYPIGAFDLDGDGRSEIVGTRSVYVVSTGEWMEFDVGCGHYGTVSAAAADVNADGLLDILLGTAYGQSAGAIHFVQSNP